MTLNQSAPLVHRHPEHNLVFFLSIRSRAKQASIKHFSCSPQNTETCREPRNTKLHEVDCLGRRRRRRRAHSARTPKERARRESDTDLYKTCDIVQAKVVHRSLQVAQHMHRGKFTHRRQKISLLCALTGVVALCFRRSYDIQDSCAIPRHNCFERRTRSR